jgi:hypothetical protein
MRSGWRISSKDEIGQDEYDSVKIVWGDFIQGVGSTWASVESTSSRPLFFELMSQV